MEPRPGLTPLQQEVLCLLAPLDPPWTLSGGAALIGFHLGHRTTRDLDLFWRGTDDLGHVCDEVARILKSQGLEVETLQRGATFLRLRVTGSDETVILDLVADPTSSIEPAQRATVKDAEIRIDSRYELLVSKLTALIGRSELRDLVDLRALLGGGEDLLRALEDAPRRDAGFSVLTLAWALRNLPVQKLAEVEGMADAEVEALVAFRDGLVERLTELARPDE